MKKSILPVILLLCTALIVIFSCHKKGPPINYGGKFDGLWTGINSCDSQTHTINIASPVDNVNSVYYTGHTDTGFCSRSITFVGTAYGDTILFPATVYTDSCGNGYTVQQVGTIIGVTLVLTRITTGTINDTCVFMATKY